MKVLNSCVTYLYEMIWRWFAKKEEDKNSVTNFHSTSSATQYLELWQFKCQRVKKCIGRNQYISSEQIYTSMVQNWKKKRIRPNSVDFFGNGRDANRLKKEKFTAVIEWHKSFDDFYSFGLWIWFSIWALLIHIYGIHNEYRRIFYMKKNQLW